MSDETNTPPQPPTEEEHPRGLIEDAWAIAKGMGTVWKQTFRPDNTERYPQEIAPIPERSHVGRHLLNRHENGLEKCIGCGALRVRVPGRRDLGGGRRQRSRGRRREPGGALVAKDYQINYLRCIMCGLCVEACPTRALTLTSHFEMSFTSREEAIWTKEQLLDPAAGARRRPGRELED